MESQVVEQNAVGEEEEPRPLQTETEQTPSLHSGWQPIMIESVGVTPMMSASDTPEAAESEEGRLVGRSESEAQAAAVTPPQVHIGRVEVEVSLTEEPSTGLETSKELSETSKELSESSKELSDASKDQVEANLREEEPSKEQKMLKEEEDESNRRFDSSSMTLELASTGEEEPPCSPAAELQMALGAMASPKPTVLPQSESTEASLMMEKVLTVGRVNTDLADDLDSTISDFSAPALRPDPAVASASKGPAPEPPSTSSLAPTPSQFSKRKTVGLLKRFFSRKKSSVAPL